MNSVKAVKSIYSLSFDKMANLRKKDMEKSMDRLKKIMTKAHQWH